MLDKKVIYQLKRDIKKKKTAFLVGAGISIPPPSNIRRLPQEDCIKTILDLSLEKINTIVQSIRPEVFFQVLYNTIGERALKPMEIINPRFLNSKEAIVFPNYIHYFLAEMIKKGHLVITTNFDSLIEEAYENITKDKQLNVIIHEDQFHSLSQNLNKLKSGVLIKFHGSFIDQEGKDSKDTIRLILEQVQIKLPDFKRDLIQELINNFNFVIMGYSGRDDYDLFSFLLNPPENRNIYWIKHLEDSNPNKWYLTPTNQLIELNKRIDTLPSTQISTENWANLNANSIVLAYTSGMMITAHTTQFLTSLNMIKSIAHELGDTLKVNEKIEIWMKKWAETINLIERNEIIANLFETIGGSFLKDALLFFEKANSLRSSFFKANMLLNNGRINYKMSNLNEGEMQLKAALKFFEEIESKIDQAECYQQLTLINNRLKNVDMGRIYGEKAIEYFLEQEKYFEVAQVLRGLALVTIAGIPDVYTLDNPNEKNQCIKLLDEAMDLCNRSLRILRTLGNRTGKRGENQSLNVIGIIFLRLGKFEEAKDNFKSFLDLSGRSRFSREIFQGYRNLALSLYHLSLKSFEYKRKYLQEALESFNHSLECLGIDPMDPIHVPLNRDHFMAQLNRNEALIESANKEEIDFALKELEVLEKAIPNIFTSKEIWHWNANLLFYKYKAKRNLGYENEIWNIIERIIHQYEQQNDETIENKSFGIQNAKRNLRYLIEYLKNLEEEVRREDIFRKLKDLLKRISSLHISIPSIIHKDWSDIFSKLDEFFP